MALGCLLLQLCDAAVAAVLTAAETCRFEVSKVHSGDCGVGRMGWVSVLAGGP
jgi:hypothetical protein